VLRVGHATDLGQAIVLPLLTTLVYAFVWADGSADQTPPAAIWERFLERAWAVIVIDFLVSQVSNDALSSSLGSNALDVFLGFVALGLSVMLIFADTSATVDDGVTVWTVIPRAFVRSAATVLNARTFPRALALFSVQLLLFAATYGMYAVLVRDTFPHAIFWAEVPLLTIVTPAYAALTAVVYRDAVSAAAPR
jgi:hypothetical protein